MDVIVYKTSSRHNILTVMGSSLTQALCGLGVDATFYSPTSEQNEVDVVRDIAKAKTRAVVAFGEGGADWLDESGNSVYNDIDCAYIGWGVDHPSYHFSRYSSRIARRGQVCASQSHIDFAHAIGSKSTAQLMLPGVDEVATDPLPISARKIHALVAMSWLGEPVVWWSEYKDTPVYQLVDGMVARAVADENVDLFKAFMEAAADQDIDYVINDFTCEIISKVSLFVRRYDRLKLAQELAATKVPFAIFGEGWRDRLGDRQHLIYADSLDSVGLSQLYGHARIVFNLNAGNGASERAINAMAAGAMVASDYSPLIAQSFGQAGGLKFYSRCNVDSLKPLLELASSSQQNIADKGRHVVGAFHLWKHKAAALVEMLAKPPFGLNLVR